MEITFDTRLPLGFTLEHAGVAAHLYALTDTRGVCPANRGMCVNDTSLVSYCLYS